MIAQYLVREFSVDEVKEKCGVSCQAAAFQVEKYKGEGVVIK